MHHLLISVGDTGIEKKCGFFESPADTADVILFNCANGAEGRYAMITTMSDPGVKEYLHVCEIKVFVR